MGKIIMKNSIQILQHQLIYMALASQTMMRQEKRVLR